MKTARPLTNRQLQTPRTAAAAGILFALLLSASYTLIRLSIPPDPADGIWVEAQAEKVSLALSLVPIAGIAFLWFMGVLRDRMGQAEDQFFSTIFFGSGLLFLAMTFVSAALASGLLTTYTLQSGSLFNSDIYLLGRAVIYRISNIYAVRMASVFMLSLGTIWVRTLTMPRWLALLTYGLALVLLFTIDYSLWVVQVFPAWVLIISLYILVINFRPSDKQETEA